MNQLNSKIEIYTSQSGEAQIEVKFDGETVWLNLNQISNLFGKHKSVVSRHLKNIFNSGELHKDSVVAKYATTALDGKIYVVEYFNLDVIISIGYRVNSIRGAQFRQWATKRIAAACFLMFLDRNGLLYATTGQTIISNEALASLTLFVAASNSSEMETVKKLLISVLNRNMS